MLEGELSLGMFLTNVGIFTKIGGCWGHIYKKVLELIEIFPSLFNIVTAMNRQTDVAARKDLAQFRDRETLACRRREREAGICDSDVRIPLDRLKIVMGNIPFEYNTQDAKGRGRRITPLNVRGTIEIEQGELVCLIGPRGGGKSTLMNILGGNILPSAGHLRGSMRNEKGGGVFFVPSHLRILQVTSVSLFFEGTLLDNLTFGVRDGDPDEDLRRVKAICSKIGVNADIACHIDAGDEHLWSDVFSSTECQLVSVARALIANPDVLCIHRPTQLLDDQSSEVVTQALREFVDTRGLEATRSKSWRAPRTCIITTSDQENIKIADSVFVVSREGGIRRVEEAEEAIDLSRGRSFKSS